MNEILTIDLLLVFLGICGVLVNKRNIVNLKYIKKTKKTEKWEKLEIFYVKVPCLLAIVPYTGKNPTPPLSTLFNWLFYDTPLLVINSLSAHKEFVLFGCIVVAGCVLLKKRASSLNTTTPTTRQADDMLDSPEIRPLDWSNGYARRQMCYYEKPTIVDPDPRLAWLRDPRFKFNDVWYRYIPVDEATLLKEIDDVLDVAPVVAQIVSTVTNT